MTRSKKEQAPTKTYWLIKSEPDVFSWTQLVKDQQARWDGVRSYEARNNLRAMKLGDLALFYHSNIGKEIVGIARIKKTFYQDPTTTEDWSAVDIEPVVALTNHVTLPTMKENSKLAEMALLKKSRLSVSPVLPQEFEEILKMSKTTLPIE
jgi:predicted RNA-binding protein with PUA-like domain